jgi:hypothetical protein
VSPGFKRAHYICIGVEVVGSLVPAGIRRPQGRRSLATRKRKFLPVEALEISVGAPAGVDVSTAHQPQADEALKRKFERARWPQANGYHSARKLSEPSQRARCEDPESRKQSGFADAIGEEFGPQDRTNARGIWHVKRPQA